MPHKTKPVTIALSDSEKGRLEAFASDIPYPVRGSYDRFVLAAEDAVMRSLDVVTLLALHAIKNAPRPPAPVIIENLPFDASVTRGPVDPEALRTGKRNALSETILTGLVARVGEPYAIRFEGEGLVSNLSPRRSHAGSLTGLGSREELSVHIENAAARTMEGDRAPDGLALIGVSAEPGEAPATVVADGRLAVELAGARCEAVLRDPAARFAIRVPERWRRAGAADAVRTPLLAGPSDAPSIVAALYGDMLTALDGEAEEALRTFRRCLEAVEIDVVVRPGNAVLLSNHFILHGRRAFEAAFDAQGRPHRWLQRLFWTSSLRRFHGWPCHRGRVIEPLL